MQWSAANPNNVGAGSYQLIGINSNGCADTVNVVVKQDVATWTGTTNTDWHTATNWNTGMVPTAKTHVIIPAGTPACLISTSDATTASVQPKAGCSFTVGTGRNLIITSKCNPLPN